MQPTSDQLPYPSIKQTNSIVHSIQCHNCLLPSSVGSQNEHIGSRLVTIDYTDIMY